jgi:hypothetical protein
MDKRYQVFVSSTFRDLRDERREVIQALLEMDCIPAGMELFPAADRDAWNLITRVIDQSDYYVLVVGGKYGSVDAEGISFTEKEYDYALSQNKHILPFLHEHPDQIIAGKSELEASGRERLTAFRKKVEAVHHCKYWNTAEDLGGKVSRAIKMALKMTPSVGWIRADQAKTIEDVEKLAFLQRELAKLESENKSLESRLLQQQERDGSSRATPQIVTDFQRFFRRLKLEWEMEQESKPIQVRDAKKILTTAREKLLTFSNELDDSRDADVKSMLKQSLVRLTEMLRSEGMSVEEQRVFWNEGRTLVRGLEGLEQIIRSRTWT